MKQIITEKKEIITCDSCGKQYDKPYIYFETIDDVQMRIYEFTKSTSTSHLTYGRKMLDFCSTDCALKYLSEDAKIFIKEITARFKR